MNLGFFNEPLHATEDPPPLVHDDGGDEEETLDQWHDRVHQEREARCDDVRRDSPEGDFEVQTSLRVVWLAAQRADPDLTAMFNAPRKDSVWRTTACSSGQ